MYMSMCSPTLSELSSSLDRRSTIGYCTFLRGNLVTWKSKKNTVVARLVLRLSTGLWLLPRVSSCGSIICLEELRFEVNVMYMDCDNQATFHIVSNPVFYDRTKHIEVDCYLVREQIEKGIYCYSICIHRNLASLFVTKPHTAMGVVV